MAHITRAGSAGSLHRLPLTVVAIHRRGAAEGRDGPADPWSARRRAPPGPAAAGGPASFRAGSLPVPGPPAAAAICSRIPCDQAVIHASWVSSQPSSPAGSATGTGGGAASSRTGGEAASSRTGRAGRGRRAVGGPSNSVTSVSSATGRGSPHRVTIASPPLSASNSPQISHIIHVLRVTRAQTWQSPREPRLPTIRRSLARRSHWIVVDLASPQRHPGQITGSAAERGRPLGRCGEGGPGLGQGLPAVRSRASRIRSSPISNSPP